jgi:hypothetical protein
LTIGLRRDDTYNAGSHNDLGSIILVIEKFDVGKAGKRRENLTTNKSIGNVSLLIIHWTKSAVILVEFIYN